MAAVSTPSDAQPAAETRKSNSVSTERVAKATTPELAAPRFLSSDEKLRFAKTRHCPPHVAAQPDEWEVLWEGGSTFLFARSWESHDAIINRLNLMGHADA